MKTSIHPDNYRLVVFEDEAAGFSFLTRSTAPTNETTKWEDGNEYPVVKVHISSASHPFFTGEEKIIDTEGRVDRFAAKMKAAQAHRDELAKKAAAAKAQAEKAAKNDEKADKESYPYVTNTPLAGVFSLLHPLTVIIPICKLISI